MYLTFSSFHEVSETVLFTWMKQFAYELQETVFMALFFLLGRWKRKSVGTPNTATSDLNPCLMPLK